MKRLRKPDITSPENLSASQKTVEIEGHSIPKTVMRKQFLQVVKEYDAIVSKPEIT